MKNIFIMLLILVPITMAAQKKVSKPKVSYSQIVKLARGKNPKSVLKGTGLQEFCYSYSHKEKYLGCCSYGYNVRSENYFNALVPLTDDAFGISYSDAGSGCWEIVFKDEAQLEAYKKDAVKNGYAPLYDQWQTFSDDGVEKKQLIYIRDADEEFCNCIRIVFNGNYYCIRIGLEVNDFSSPQ